MKVIIRKTVLKEVSSEKQRRYMCAMKDEPADKRPEGLSKAEAEEMCGEEVKEGSTAYGFLDPVKVRPDEDDMKTRTMGSEPVEPESIDLPAAELEMTRRQLWGKRKATIMRTAKEAWLEWDQGSRDYDWAGADDKIALNVLANDPDAENRVKSAAGEFQEFKKPIIRLISDARAGLESLSEKEKKLFLRYLMITGLEFGLHTEHTSTMGRFGDIVIALLKKYLKNPAKNPRSLSERWKDYSDQYDINFTMNPIVFNLRENKAGMKPIMESWRKFLSEDEINEKLMLKKGKDGWWLYSKLVAEAYRTAPDMGDGLNAAYEKLGKWLEGEFGRISTRVRFEFVPEHVYTSAADLRQRVADEGVMYVSTLDAEHPAWKGEQGLIWNTMFRAWHDWEGHIAKGKNFNLRHEIGAYNAHAKRVPQDLVPILFTEVVGQICCFYHNNKSNCPQKVTILDDFDFLNVGALTPKGEERFGYTLDKEKKLLVPIGEEKDLTPEE